ncbi:hypothetical protein EVAR_95719_1 [Eumeta japonica]|uniref:Uncharacterized protein n=1 Tax=Eumeta variegata TaxID=151549 RepID=A0A4C1UKE5_EUMVA|nr:hypothetical protein EVAR_95719_1 [Eumeta japonica]
MSLLNMVRARRRKLSLEDEVVQTIKEPDENSNEDVESDKICIHDVNPRSADRSASRSRFSRISTRRDMDVPTILAYTAEFISPPQPTKELLAFEKPKDSPTEPAPRWSIRRSTCPVCSQKWRDRSSLKIPRGSGLKRYSSLETPSVIAPARLRSAIQSAYAPRQRLPAIDENRGSMSVMWRSVVGASWHLSRARRCNTAKSAKLNARETVVAANVSSVHKELDSRVRRFLSSKS